MNKIAKIDDAKATPPGVATRPVSLWTMGRQRVGKTTFLNGLVETVRARGGNPELWNADLQNRTSSLSTFFEDALQPGESMLGEQKLWLESRIGQQILSGNDAVLDIGGGWTALHQLVEEGPVGALLASEGIDLTLVYVLGPDRADVDYLEDMQARGLLLPERSLIVFNNGLVPWGYDPIKAFSSVIAHPVVVAAQERGAAFAFMPSLSCLEAVGRQGLSLSRFLDPTAPAKHPPVQALDRMKVRRWLEQDFPAFLRKVPTGWLPRLGAGREY